MAGLCALLVWVLLAAPASAETRRLKLYNLHTKERATITFKKDGKYVQSGLKRINHFLRDWRRDEPTKMDPALLDLVWDVYRKSGSRDYIHIISGYRAPTTNSMLRKRGRGVAKNSLHTLGRALDFFLPDVKLAKLREVGLKHGYGGVGFYPTSGSPFVHMDTGNVRHWPRMERNQLARMFPDGKTMHIPKDGKPLPGYEQAKQTWLAKRNGKEESLIAEADEEESPNLFARLFQRRTPKDEEPPAEAETVADSDVEAAPAEGPEVAEEEVLPAKIPVPTLAPRELLNGGQELQIAAAEPGQPDKLPVPTIRAADSTAAEGPVEVASLTPDDIADLRASAVPSSQIVEPQITEDSDARTVLAGPGTGDQPELTAPNGKTRDSSVVLSFASDDEPLEADNQFRPALRQAGPASGNSGEPYFGPAQSTLELALAANEKSSEATEAIRKLISVSQTGSVERAPTAPIVSAPTRSDSETLPVPARNPVKDGGMYVASINSGQPGSAQERPARVSRWVLASDRGLSRSFNLQAPDYGRNAVWGHGGTRITTDLRGVTPRYVPGRLSLSGNVVDPLVTASTN